LNAHELVAGHLELLTRGGLQGRTYLVAAVRLGKGNLDLTCEVLRVDVVSARYSEPEGVRLSQLHALLQFEQERECERVVPRSPNE
jgi:hypothetical protein